MSEKCRFFHGEKPYEVRCLYDGSAGNLITEAELRAHLRTLAIYIGTDKDCVCPVKECDNWNYCGEGKCFDILVDYAIEHPTEE